MQDNLVSIREIEASLERPAFLCAETQVTGHRLKIYRTGERPGNYVTIAYNSTGIVDTVIIDSDVETRDYRGEYMSPTQFIDRARRLTL